MIYVIDTNVVSELMRPRPEPLVALWLTERPLDSIIVPTMVVAEVVVGIEMLPPGRRRREISAVFDSLMTNVFGSRVVDIDRDAAVAYAVLSARRRLMGRPLPVGDGLIAGVAASRDAVIVTRNTDDFEDLGITLINPWAA